MKPIRPGEPYGAAHLIERQMLLSSVRQKRGSGHAQRRNPSAGILCWCQLPRFAHARLISFALSGRDAA